MPSSQLASPKHGVGDPELPEASTVSFAACRH